MSDDRELTAEESRKLGASIAKGEDDVSRTMRRAVISAMSDESLIEALAKRVPEEKLQELIDLLFPNRKDRK